jgi:hypothetical protein
VILLINGAFGIGKSTLTEALMRERPEWVLFDPEDVGQTLRHALHRVLPVDDFQEYPAWVPLVVETARALRETTGRDLILPICVADVERYARLTSGLWQIDAELRTYCLVAPPDVVRGRLLLRGDEAGGWADARVDRCCHAHAAPVFGPFLDATQTVDRLLAEVLAVETETYESLRTS